MQPEHSELRFARDQSETERVDPGHGQGSQSNDRLGKTIRPRVPDASADSTRDTLVGASPKGRPPENGEAVRFIQLGIEVPRYTDQRQGFSTHSPTHKSYCLARLPRTLAVPAVL